MIKKLIMYMPLSHPHEELSHPYQGILQAEDKQYSLLTSFPENVEIYMARGETTHIKDNIFLPQFTLNKQGDWEKCIGEEINADLVLGFKIPPGVDRIFNTIKPISQDKTII